jgi:hypothetical protein
MGLLYHLKHATNVNQNKYNKSNFTVNRNAKSSTPMAERGYGHETTYSRQTTHSPNHQALNIPRITEVKRRMTWASEEIMEVICCYVCLNNISVQLHFNIRKEMWIKLEKEHWYKHVPKLIETRLKPKVTILWNKEVQTDRTIPNNKQVQTDRTIPNNKQVQTDRTILNNKQVQTDRTIPNNKPETIIRDNEEGTYMLIDVAISGDRNVIKKESENILK